ATGVVGQLFHYQTTATQNPFRYDATGLPNPLWINNGTGLITTSISFPDGNPVPLTSSGKFTILLSATNSLGTGTKTLTLVITSSATASACDVNKDNVTNVTDVQLTVNQVLGIIACTADINKDGRCDVVDVQRVTNAALGGVCV